MLNLKLENKKPDYLSGFLLFAHCTGQNGNTLKIKYGIAYICLFVYKYIQRFD